MSALSVDVRDLGQRAYMLATVQHETAGTYEPIEERGDIAYFARYERMRSLGNVMPGDGYRYRGRGFVQLTGRGNYESTRDRLATLGIMVNLVAEPGLACEWDVAYQVLVRGMLGGWFTGRPLGAYVAGPKLDYRNARRVVNGLDQASLIAAYANRWARELSGQGGAA